MVKAVISHVRLLFINQSELKGVKPRKLGATGKIKETFEYGVKNKGGLGPLFNFLKVIQKRFNVINTSTESLGPS